MHRRALTDASRWCGVVVALVSLAVSCSSPPGTTHATSGERAAAAPRFVAPLQCGSISPLHACGDVWLGGQPSADDLAEAKRRGVRAVLSLRKPSETPSFDEQQVALSLGLEFVSVPWQGAAELDDSVFDRTREQLARAPRALLVHCAVANRVGAVWIPYRVLDCGVELEAAVVEAKTIGLASPAFEQRARDYVASRR